MKKIVLLLVGVGLASSALFARPFQEIIGEDAEFFCLVRSLSETREQWDTHPIAELCQDEQLLEFFDVVWADETEDLEESDAPTGFTEVMEEVFDLSYDELFELFPGQASLAFYNVSDQILDREGRDEMVLMAEFSGDAARLDALMDIQFERNMAEQQAFNPLVEHTMIKETFMGETLFFDETFDGATTYIEDGYALVDGIFILATPESRLREAVESIKEGASHPIADSEAYQRSREEGGRGDVVFYLNLEQMMPSLNQAWIDSAMLGNLGMMGVTSQSLDRTLALESMQAVYVDFDLIDSGVLMSYGLIYREKLGFLSLLSYASDDLPQARYVPEDVLSSSITTFDCSQMLVQLEQLLTSVSPTLLPLIDMQLQQIKTNTGVDLRASLLDNFGPETVSLNVLSESDVDGEESLRVAKLFAMEVNDTQALVEAINVFKDMVPGARAMIEEQTYEGQTIYTFRAPTDPNQPNQNVLSYAILRSSLLVNVGDVGVLRKVLTRIEDGGDGLWQSSEIEHLFESIQRPHAVARSYVDAEQMVEPMFDAFRQAGELSGFVGGMTEVPSPTGLDAAYRLVSELNEAPDGFFGRTLISKSEEGQ
jgi:hypothetical protein